MTTQIKITELTNIGNSLNQNTLVPVVNMAGTPTTQKANLQIVGNLILNNAGNGFPSANSSIYSQSVTNAAQPNITSVGTLTSLTVAGNVNLGSVANVRILGGAIGQVLTTDGAGNLSWVADGTSYGNSNVASYLPTYTGNLTAGNISVTGNISANNIGNIAELNLDGNTSNILYGNGMFAASPSVSLTGDGGNLSNINGANVSGTVPNAEFANSVYVEAVSNNFSYHVVLTTGPMDYTLHNDIDDDFQYNPADGILTVTRVDATYFVGDLAFAHGLPAGNVTGLGNIAGINLNGNGNQVLGGNGAWVAQTGGGGGNLGNLQVNDTRLEIANGASETSLFIGNGPAGLTMNQDSGSDAFLRLSANTTGGEFYNAGNEYSTGDYVSGGIGGIITLNGAPTIETFLNNLSFPAQIVSLTINGTDTVPYDGGGWGGGTVTFNTTTPPSVDPTVVTSITLNIVYVNQFILDEDEGDFGIYIGDENFDIESLRDIRIDAGDDFSIESNDGFDLRSRDTDSGGGIRITTDYSNTNYTWLFDNTGNLTLPSNSFNINYANGTQVPLGGGSTGNVTFDDVTVQGVNGLNLSAGSDYTANLAYIRVRAGDVASHIHMDTGNNEAYDLIIGDDQNFVQVSSTGNIIMSSYDSNTSQYIWTLDTTGNLILAGGNSVIQSVANSSLDPVNPNVSTMILTPDANYSSQSLVLDPTSPGHIHLRAPGTNIEEPLANLFLGGENSSFEVGVYNGSAPNLFIHSGGNTWTFSNDGNLTTPSNLVIGPGPIGGSSISQYDAPLQVVSESGNGALIMGWAANQNSPDSIAVIAMNSPFSNGASNVLIAVGNNATTVNYWNFDNTGVLTVPNNILGSNTASPAPYISGFSSIETFDGANIAGFVFDTSNLTLPGNSVAINFANGSAAFANLVQWTTAPVANTSAGTAGQAAYDTGGNLYVCVSTNTWAKFTGTTSW